MSDFFFFLNKYSEIASMYWSKFSTIGLISFWNILKVESTNFLELQTFIDDLEVAEPDPFVGSQGEHEHVVIERLAAGMVMRGAQGL